MMFRTLVSWLAETPVDVGAFVTYIVSTFGGLGWHFVL